MTAIILHHMARFPARMGRSTPWDGKWFLTSGQAIAGHWLTYNMPDDILDCTGPAQTYSTDRVQREISNTPGLKELNVVTSEENLEDLKNYTSLYVDPKPLCCTPPCREFVPCGCMGTSLRSSHTRWNHGGMCTPP